MTPGPLTRVRGDRQQRLAVTTVVAVLGVALAVLHWAGLVVAGALVALPQRSVSRGLAAGLGLGLLVVAGFLSWFALAGTLGPVLAMGQPAWLALGIGLLLPAFGSLTRGII